MRAGKLRHLLEIQNFTTSQDAGTGEEPKTFGEGSNAFGVVSGSIKTLRGRELVAAQAEFAEAEVEIGVRYLAGVNSGMRIKHDPAGCCIAGADASTVRYYNVLNVNDVEERHVEMVLTCETGLADSR